MATDRPRSRLREPSLLLNPAPVIVASLAVFLAVLVALTARVAAGHDPALARVAAIRQPAGNGAGATVTTRVSGAPAAGGAQSGQVGGLSQPHGPVVTATSGASSGGLYSGGDDGA